MPVRSFRHVVLTTSTLGQDRAGEVLNVAG